MTNKITLRKTGTKTFTVFANGRPCVGRDGFEWAGDYSVMAFKASGLARELGWPVFLEFSK